MKKYAVIDIGSNTVRMVVYAVEENDTFHALFSKVYTGTCRLCSGRRDVAGGDS